MRGAVRDEHPRITEEIHQHPPNVPVDLMVVRTRDSRQHIRHHQQPSRGIALHLLDQKGATPGQVALWMADALIDAALRESTPRATGKLKPRRRVPSKLSTGVNP